jgi:hypothetical protein
VGAEVDGRGADEQAAVVAHEKTAQCLDGLRFLDLLLHDLVEVFHHQHEDAPAGRVVDADGLGERVGDDGIVLFHREPVIQGFPSRAGGAEDFAD